MREAARRNGSQNDFNRANNQCDALRHFLTGGYSASTAAEWLEYAQSKAAGLEQDQPTEREC